MSMIAVLQNVQWIDDRDHDLFRLGEAVLAHVLSSLVDHFAKDRADNGGDDEVGNAWALGPAFDEIFEAGGCEG